jgi:hypothetical protein
LKLQSTVSGIFKCIADQGNPSIFLKIIGAPSLAERFQPRSPSVKLGERGYKRHLRALKTRDIRVSKCSRESLSTWGDLGTQ